MRDFVLNALRDNARITEEKIAELGNFELQQVKDTIKQLEEEHVIRGYTAICDDSADDGKVKAVITQNIDGLHQMAGSKHVLELHGSIHRNYCQSCKKFYDAKYVKNSKGIPKCECGGTIKPDVVLYEEGLDNETIRESIRAISEADMLMIGGTSLVVYPAAGFIDYFRGKYLVVINKSATPRDSHADLCIQEPIGEVLGNIVL